ncbi:DUF421 domain-containing protein [Aequorivita lipolytica]|uniref:DUF421 domain-containing protein n=1 Tax=Aequorivita lipolytica TaxID=153267 RepID=A0A5C6YSY6_9FLAO|nr:YetF domain-containing protein [Aequorivita lipolytica]TXD70061.1 DUF421 domain-containing protein [Aequorivita lipolytica]SRX50469.1 hypothetical protein AEQU2_00942 [Aequorivita lipolytica]
MNWIYSSNDPLFQTLIGCFIIFVVIIIFTRISGLRAFAKFTAYDFAFTVAIGSIISSTLTSSTSLAHGAIAIGGLLLITLIFSYLQRKFPALSRLISNAALLLMDGNTILHENLKNARIEENQLITKLREANVLNYDQVFAVVLEATGDISVLHAADSNKNERFDKKLLSGVRKIP